MTKLYLSNYTVELYRERFGVPQPLGSGLLITFQDKYLIISAYHVIDMEDERIRIENDPDEADIPQDDMERIMAKGKDIFFAINDNVKSVVLTAHYDADTKEPIFSDDVEWCVCELSEEIVKYFIEKGKSFYEIDENLSLNIESGTQIIVSGYPGYAQKGKEEVCRSFKSELIEEFKMTESGLFKVHFNQFKAYCLELEKEIQIPPREGISGMSGGGLWYLTVDNCVPLGIIIKQDPNENYVEGFSLTEILKSYTKEYIYEKLN